MCQVTPLFLDEPRIKEIVERAWARATRQRYPLAPYEFVVMPNHVHGIVWITEQSAESHPSWTKRAPVGAQRGSRAPDVVRLADPTTERRTLLERRAAPLQRWAPERGSLGAIVRSFKSDTAWRISRSLGRPAKEIWQRNYYERVIRNETELDQIRQYILDNPGNRATDKNNRTLIVSSIQG